MWFTIWSIAKIIFLLALMAGLIYGSLYLFKKYVFAFDKDRSKLIKIKVLSTHMLMPKKFIQVVQVHDKVLVLGVSDHSITVLEELEGLENALDDDVLGGGGGLITAPKDLKANLKDNLKENFLDLLKKNMGMK